ncbi:hypothetical protein JB92DRAFT_3130472 [Gautieria morchelliformis]|nr:hypothetical protein JB92DRAFT_3130472 [Gautieria morchelliformis]
MTHCQGCSNRFPRLDSILLQCAKYDKLLAATSETKRKAIEVLPQCLGCGVVYPFLKSKLCGKCNEDAEKEPQLFSGCDDVMNHILKRTAKHEGSASDHRLNRRSQNPSLKKGSEILKKTQALRKLSKMDSIGIKLTIWYYPAVRSREVVSLVNKIQIPAVVEGFTATTLATEMIDRLLEHAEKVYDKAAIADKPTPKPFFLRDKVVFVVAKTVHESSYLDIDQPNLFCTVQALHEKLEKDSLLSDKDIKGKCITMQLRLYEVKSDTTDEDIECDSRPIPPFHMRSVARSSKRKLSSISHEEPLPSAKHYVSAYQRRSGTGLGNASAPKIEYDTYPFYCETYLVNVEGEVTEKEDSIDIKTILIPKNWRKYVNTGKREEGYLGYGYANLHLCFAVLQLKNLNGDTEYLNKYDLKCELKLLAWGKFFLDSFIRRAQQYGAKNIPEMKWNADGAFLGMLVDKLPDLPAEQRSNQSLIWNVFLAVPLLEPGATERKFSGNGDTGENSDYLGIWIDEFAHHTVVDSMGEYVFVDIQGFVYSENRVILFDPQAHTFDGSSGFWDKGRSGILQFLKEHKCNKISRKLGLNTEVVVVPAPLNDIAVPQMEVLPTIKPRNLHRQWEL